VYRSLDVAALWGNEAKPKRAVAAGRISDPIRPLARCSALHFGQTNPMGESAAVPKRSIELSRFETSGIEDMVFP
jgi:hypothetical protein